MCYLLGLYAAGGQSDISSIIEFPLFPRLCTFQRFLPKIGS